MKYQGKFEAKKFHFPLLSWMKYGRDYETTNLSELKNIVKKYFEMDDNFFEGYFNSLSQ